MSTSTRCAIVMAAALLAPVVAAQHSDLIVGTDRGREISVNVPFGAARTFEGALLAVAASDHTPIGVETIQTSAVQDKVAQHPLMLTGLPVDRAFKELLGPGSVNFGQPYQLIWPAGVAMMHVTSFGGRKTFLDSQVEVFEARDMLFSHSLGALHRLFDHRFPETGGLSGVVDTDGASPRPTEDQQQVWSRRMSISLKNTTVRDRLRVIWRHDAHRCRSMTGDARTIDIA